MKRTTKRKIRKAWLWFKDEILGGLIVMTLIFAWFTWFFYIMLF